MVPAYRDTMELGLCLGVNIMAREDNTINVGWFLVGAAVGAAVALLYAPHSGKETRRLIAKKGEQSKEVLIDSGKEVMDRGKELFDRDRVPLAFNCYVVETGEYTVLIETGGGDNMDSRARERMKLPARLDPLSDLIASQGIDPERIDVVINTHLHWDHCGWNTRLEGGTVRPTFPHAAYYTRK